MIESPFGNLSGFANPFTGTTGKSSIFARQTVPAAFGIADWGISVEPTFPAAFGIADWGISVEPAFDADALDGEIT